MKTKKAKKIQDCLNLSNKFGCYVECNYYEGVYFTPLYSKKEILSNGRYGYGFKDGIEGIFIHINDEMHFIFHKGNWAKINSELERDKQKHIKERYNIRMNIIAPAIAKIYKM